MRYKCVLVLVLILCSAICAAETPPTTRAATTIEDLNERVDALAAENRALREEVTRLRVAARKESRAVDAERLRDQLEQIGVSVRQAYKDDEEKTWPGSKVSVGWPRIDVESSASLVYPIKGTITYHEVVKGDGTQQVCIVTLVMGLRSDRWECISANRYLEKLTFGTKPAPPSTVNGDEDVTGDFESWVGQAVTKMLGEKKPKQVTPTNSSEAK